MILSIIVPVYNTKDYLQQCVDSILACDCSDCEIILLDDGSNDGESPALCDALASQNSDLIRVIHQENQGLGGARNTGLEAARGQYVFFPDSDDTVTPNALTVIKNAIKQTGSSILSFNFSAVSMDGHSVPMKANAFDCNTPFRLADRPDFLLSIPSACCRVYEKKLFIDSGIRYPSRVWYEDLRTTMKLFALAPSILALPEHLYNYLQRPGSIMRSSNIDRNREIIEAFDDLLSWYRKQGLFETYRQQLCGLCIEHLYLAASVRVLRADPKHPLLGQFRNYISQQFPDYQESPFLAGLSRPRHLAFRLLEHRCYSLLRLMFRIYGSP